MLTTGKWCNPVINMLHHGIEGVELGLDTRGLRMAAALWGGIPEEVTQETGIVPHHRCVAIGTPI